MRLFKRKEKGECTSGSECAMKKIKKRFISRGSEGAAEDAAIDMQDTAVLSSLFDKAAAETVEEAAGSDSRVAVEDLIPLKEAGADAAEKIRTGKRIRRMLKNRREKRKLRKAKKKIRRYEKQKAKERREKRRKLIAGMIGKVKDKRENKKAAKKARKKEADLLLEEKIAETASEE